MKSQSYVTFDEVFKSWIDSEVNSVRYRSVLEVAQSKGFTSLIEWRLATALRLGMDKKIWTFEIIDNPNVVLPQVIIGPYQGWSQFFNNTLTTTFAHALKNKEFFDWCSEQDRIISISENFPLPTNIILFRKSDGSLIHIEGGHRICAVAYRQKIGKPIRFASGAFITAAIASITEEEVGTLLDFLHLGTFNQKTL